MSEKLIIALDSQRFSAAQGCLFRFNMRFNKHIDKADTSTAISKGTLFHELLRYYYFGRMKIETPEFLVTKENLPEGLTLLNNLTPFESERQAVPIARRKIPELTIDEDSIIEVISTFSAYVQHYAGEPWEILNVESPFSVILYEDDKPRVVAGVEYSGLVILWEGIIDLEVRNDNGDIYPIDHKTASRRNYPDELNNQFHGYVFAKGSKMMVVNQIEFKKSPDKFNREFLVYPSYMVDNWVQSVIDTVERKLIPAISDDYWYREMHDCNQKFQCVFTDYCKADKVSQKFLLQTKYKETKPWDPFSRDE